VELRRGYDVDIRSRRRGCDSVETGGRLRYLGTQSDFHTHCHDLPPQMGGCYGSAPEARLVDARLGGIACETSAPAPPDAAAFAASRVAQFKDDIVSVNGETDDAAALDEALRATLTNMLEGTAIAPPPGTAAALRYVRDRVNVPRDMPLWSARALCKALEETAALDSTASPRSAIPVADRRDQDPKPFQRRDRAERVTA